MQVEGYMYSTSQNRMRMRLYHTRQDVFPNYVFTPIVSPPAASPDFKPRVDWEQFHSVEPLPAAISSKGRLSPDLQRVTSHWGLGGCCSGPAQHTAGCSALLVVCGCLVCSASPPGPAHE